MSWFFTMRPTKIKLTSCLDHRLPTIKTTQAFKRTQELEESNLSGKMWHHNIPHLSSNVRLNSEIICIVKNKSQLSINDVVLSNINPIHDLNQSAVVENEIRSTVNSQFSRSDLTTLKSKGFGNKTFHSKKTSFLNQNSSTEQSV